MKTLTRWFISNPVAANLLMVMILAAGLLSLTHLRVESFPQMPPTRLVVSVVYPGATAEQVEQGITRRVEEAVSGLPGILTIESESTQGFSSVRIRRRAGTDLNRLLEDVRVRVDGIVGFPTGAERPQVWRDEFTNLAAFIVIYGDTAEEVLQQMASRTEKALKAHPQISQVTNLGKRRPELVIEPQPEQLHRHGLDLNRLVERIEAWSLEYRAGELKTAGGRVQLKADGLANSTTELQRLPIVETGQGRLTLGELASIQRDYEEDDSRVRFQGQPAVVLMVSTSKKDHLIRVSESIEEVLHGLKPELPMDVSLDVMADMAPYIEEQLGLLSTSAFQGLAIVLVLLGIFLNLRLAFWVAMGIPVAVAGTFWLMGLQGLDYSLNDITLFGLILVLGILIDDAVVVGESIHQCRQQHDSPLDAAIAGVERVAVPTVFGVLTTIAAFSPMLWIDNELAKLLAGFSAVVIFALCFSLVESKFILPSHLAHGEGRMQRLPRWNGQNQRFCQDGLESATHRYYLPLLKRCLTHRGAVIVVFLALMLLAYGLVAKGTLRSVLFPEIPGRYLTATVTMQQDAPFALTLRSSEQLEQAANQINVELQERYGLAQAPLARLINSVDGSGAIEVTAELTSEALRELPAQVVIEQWREATGNLEGSYSTDYTASESPAGPVGLGISHRDPAVARRLARQLKQELRQLQGLGVQSITDDAQGGGQQLLLRVNEYGQQLGITQRQLTLLAGGGFGGIELYRLMDDGEETRVMLRFSGDQRRHLQQLLDAPIPLQGIQGFGGNRTSSNSVTVGEVAELTFAPVPDQIYRRGGKRVINVYWRQNRDLASPEAILAKLRKGPIPKLESQYPGATIKPLGEFEEIVDVQAGFKKAMLMTLLLIYVLLAVPLKSYGQPLIIMAVIPFGFAGAIWGHALLQLPVSLLSLLGMMAMTGVVVNDSLVLLSRFNELYRAGIPLNEALMEAGRTRLRAIFLTTVTTVCGLLPLLLETSEQAQYLKPAAVSLVFGELFATPITLILVPLMVSLGASLRNNTAVAGNSNYRKSREVSHAG